MEKPNALPRITAVFGTPTVAVATDPGHNA